MRRRILLNSSVIDPTTGRGTIGDYEVVDLGLPSGLLWATCNVGATKETGYGNYYQWGAGTIDIKDGGNYHTGGTDSSYTLPSSADTATQVMGSEWRMPTADELRELKANTTYSYVTIDDVKYGKFTSKINPNAYVFFPTAGYYHNWSPNSVGKVFDVWSSTPYDSSNAYNMQYNPGYNWLGVTYDTRNDGYSVRGVHAAI